MSWTSENLKTFAAFWETIVAAVDCIPNPTAPSAVGRVKGTLRNFHAQMSAILFQLDTREPAPKDDADLDRMVVALETLLADKWVTDGWGSTEIDWHGLKAAEAAGIAVAPSPLTLQSALGMLLLGLADLRKL